MKWLLDGPLGAWDTESTGVNVETDRVVTATVAALQPGTPWAVDTRSWLIWPEVQIPAEATAVHGITTEHAREHGANPTTALDEIAEHLTNLLRARLCVIGMNCCFDFTLLDRDLRRHNLPTVEERLGRPIGPVVDVYVLDQWLDPYRRGGRKLVTLCHQYGVRIDGAHDSTFDALAAARVAWRIGNMTTWTREQVIDFYRRPQLSESYGARHSPREFADRLAELATMTPGGLHAKQRAWRRSQCDRLRAYFDEQKKPHDGVPADWPQLPWPPGGVQ